ncbi:MAG: NAD(+) synthase [Nitrospirota bacterium]
MTSKAFTSEDIKIADPAKAVEQIHLAIREQVFHVLKRKGAVLGLSGGIDSSVSAALCAGALGKDRVWGLFMPEQDSSGESLRLGRLVAETIGIRSSLEDIAPMLTAAGCYRRRDEAIRLVVPNYGEGFKCKIVLPNLLESDQYPIYSVVVESPDGKQSKTRLTSEAYLGIVAATNFKQRVRRMMEYYYADRLNFAVVGTPNRLEYDQGFFVKNGDGAADFKPIAHLYKSQVYQLAAYLGIPEEVQSRPPTTDTYSLDQSQEEFYFALPLAEFDLCLYGRNHGVPTEAVAVAIGRPTEQVERVYRQIASRREATRYLRMPALLAEKVLELES